MFLKHVEILGFKSFAKKVSIEFVPGVTAVVGPNGSGKSNITDAIKWVLGEQSAKSLRGSKMEDIIFSGSDTQKPLNMAEVTLTLDNSDRYMSYDYNEISVTRRVFRSGDSEYLLNKQKCRLKDIVELFMDSGVGREAYSIIGQGKIDEILNSKPEDKRIIFEEAAGVLKYKNRKISAERKLTDANDNLERVEDIIYELDAQVQPLEEQASIAKDYLHKRDELEQKEVALLAHDIETSHEEWQKRSSSVQDLKNKEVDESSIVRREEAAMEERRHRLQALDESINELQESLLAASQMVEKYEGQKNVIEERQKHAEQNAESLYDQIESLAVKVFQSKLDYQVENEKLMFAENDLTRLKEELKKHNDKLLHFEASLEQEIEQLKTDYIEVLNEQASIRNETRYLTEQKEQLQQKEQKVSGENATVKDEKNTLTSEKRRLDADLEELSAQLKRISAKENKLNNDLKAKQTELEKRNASLNRARQFLQQATSKRDMLESMNEDYSGYFHGVKRVLKAKGRELSGVHGAVAELIKVRKTYETAVETALGGAMQQILVENERHAREAIQFLKQKKAGRATFLPLSVVKPRFVPKSEKVMLTGDDAFIGIADELVINDPTYQNAISHLLGHVIVAEDLKGANRLASKIGHRHRIVTLEGDVVNPGGSMSGGSQKQNKAGLLGRKRELEQLTKQIKEMKTKIKEMEYASHTLSNECRTLSEEWQTTSSMAEKLKEKCAQKEAEVKETDYRMKRIKDKEQLLYREQQSFKDDLSAIEQKLTGLNQTYERNEGKDKTLDNKIANLNEQKQNREASKAKLEQTITELKIEVASKEEALTNRREQAANKKEELSSLVDQLQKAADTLGVLGVDLKDQEGSHQSIEHKITSSREEKTALTKWISERRKQRFELQESIENGERELKEAKRLLKSTSEMLKNEEIVLERADVGLENLINTLSETYEIGFETAKEKYPMPEDVEETREDVKLLKKAIDELGSVNLGAIDEHERVATRLQFLQNQRQDLLEAKETLLSIIDEMDREVQKRFDETFRAVKEHFRVIFKELFGGGRADLQLTDPEDLLYSGVDILAQPPGKKLQHLSLLSGGERALTAIALLFSILKVRPVPFCVLDEVEAALDDANVDRYAAFLKRFSEETQFIVVTHRKGTMEKSDVLYGVTMQESGVSKLVSVKLEETEELVGTA